MKATLALLCSMLFVGTAYADELSQALASISGRVALLHTWSHDDRSLICIVTPITDKEDAIFEVFEARDKGLAKIFSARGPSIPASISEFGDRLIVTWGTATGYIVQIYGEHGGKVTKLAEDGSNLLPEMLQLKDGDVPAIVVPVLRWTKGKSGESEQTLTSANVYLLQPNEVKVLKDMPWSKRLQAAK